MALPILYSFRRCPYAMRARMALWASGIELELREVALRNRPEELREISPKATVPVVLLPDGTVLEESVDIARWALRQGDPAAWLPTAAEAAETDRLIAVCDSEFKDHLNRYKYDTRYPDADRETERELAANFVAELEAKKNANGYLLRAEPSLVDICLFTLVRQFARADLDWFASTPFPAVRAWLTDWEQSPMFRDVMKKLRPWQPGDAVTLFRASCGG